MESKSGSTHREYTTTNSMADRQNSSPTVRMGVAESIRYRFLEKQWEEEQWAFIALVRNQKTENNRVVLFQVLIPCRNNLKLNNGPVVRQGSGQTIRVFGVASSHNQVVFEILSFIRKRIAHINNIEAHDQR